MADRHRGGPPPPKEKAPRCARRALEKLADEADIIVPHPAPDGEACPMMVGALAARVEQLEELYDQVLLGLLAALLTRGGHHG